MKETTRKTKQDVDGWIVLRWILEKYERVVRTGLVGLRIGKSGEIL
jgi:hypothetical protein